MSFLNFLSNSLFFICGIVFMGLNRMRYFFRGYRSPKPIPPYEIDRCIEYDFDVIEGWLIQARASFGPSFSIQGKTVLELGPGSDLGIGLILLAMGARKYMAFDVNPLARNVSDRFYERLFERINERLPQADIQALRAELAPEKAEPRLIYICQEGLLLREAVRDPVDVVFSQAALEHFTDVPGMLRDLDRIVSPGACFISVIDLMTHSRWLRERDPLNIYRFPEWLYRLLSFRESPNRLRPRQYLEFFNALEWKKAVFVPTRQLVPETLDKVSDYLWKPFQEGQEMAFLEGSLIAQKG